MGRPRHTREETLALAVATAVRTEQGCLIATHWRPQASGYIRVKVGGELVLLHRLLFDDIPPGMTVDHECHNSDRTCAGGPECVHRRCIEPTHLFVRDQRGNWQRGRMGFPGTVRTHCPNGHPYEGANLRPGKIKRCLACHRARQAGRDPALEPA